MSGATHTQIPMKQRLLRDPRQAKITAVGAVIALSALLVTLVLVFSDGDTPTAGTEQRAAQSTHESSDPSGPRRIHAPGQRYVNPSAAHPSAATVSSSPPSGIRYDGGPEEGALGTVAAPSSGSIRYDGGP